MYQQNDGGVVEIVMHKAKAKDSGGSRGWGGDASPTGVGFWPFLGPKCKENSGDWGGASRGDTPSPHLTPSASTTSPHRFLDPPLAKD